MAKYTKSYSRKASKLKYSVENVGVKITTPET